jgi:cobalt-zinc-cadmium efflux system protein
MGAFHHEHEHHHANPATPAFKWAVILNAGYMIGEAICGYLFNSVALLADAAHNFADVAGLLIAWGATIAATKAATRNFHFGFGKATILAALANGLTIFAGALFVIYEAAARLNHPADVPGLNVALVAGFGIFVNVCSALLFSANREDLNAEGAYLHLMADAVVSGAVVLAGALVYFTGLKWLDPLAAVLVSLLVAWTAIGLIKSSLWLALDGAPPHVDLGALEKFLRALPGVEKIQALHLWPMSTTRHALSVELVMPQGYPGDEFLHDLEHRLEDEFHIARAFLQVKGVISA